MLDPLKSRVHPELLNRILHLDEVHHHFDAPLLFWLHSPPVGRYTVVNGLFKGINSSVVRRSLFFLLYDVQSFNSFLLFIKRHFCFYRFAFLWAQTVPGDPLL